MFRLISVKKYMDWLNLTNKAIIIIGIPAIIGGCIYIGRKLQILSSLEKTMEKVKVNIKVVADALIGNTSIMFDHRELESYSPLRLTEAGNKLLEDLSFPKVFADNKTNFFSIIDNEKPRLKHDVEILSIRSVYALSDTQSMDFLKVFFYNNPDRNMENTAPTLGVYIRDRYLEEHPEINQ